MVAPLVGAALVSGAATLGGGLISGKGVSDQNAANMKIAKAQMRFQKQANAKAMRFSKRMSNTSYQRGMKDMRRAGLNPILAYKQGGASEPAGVTSAGASARMENEMAPIGDAVADAPSKYLSGKIAEANIDNIKASTALSLATSALTAEKINTEEAQQNMLNTNSALNAQKTLTETNLTEQEKIRIETALADLYAKDANVDTARLEQLKALTVRKLYETGFGQTMLWLKEAKGLPNPINFLLKKGIKK